MQRWQGMRAHVRTYFQGRRLPTRCCRSILPSQLAAAALLPSAMRRALAAQRPCRPRLRLLLPRRRPPLPASSCLCAPPTTRVHACHPARPQPRLRPHTLVEVAMT